MKIKNRIWLHTLITVFVLIFSCKKEKDVFIVYMNINPWIEYGSMTDQDGFTYKTILIGTQIWMAENLKTTKYNDGTSIPLVTDKTSWSNLSTPACCWQNNDPARKVTYGVLYNWYTVNTGKLCPTGWHVPTDAQWTTLTTYLGGESLAGGKLKESGFKHWNSPNTGATNETGFSALPGGDRLNGPDAFFDNLGEMGCWYTSSQASSEVTWNREILYNASNICRSNNLKGYGYSVRCIKD